MIDIDGTLRRAAQGRESWTTDAARDLARRLARNLSRVDHDPGAGEEWLRVVDTTDVLAIVSVKISLAIVKSGTALPADELGVVEAIEVTDFDAPSLRCTSEALELAFGTSPRYKVIDLSRFSANDLYYVTV